MTDRRKLGLGTVQFGLAYGVANSGGQVGPSQVEQILALLLSFAERNRGMTRVLTGDALVNENERLQVRINLVHDKIEAALRQALRVAATRQQVAIGTDFGALANILLCYVVGRWQQYAKSGFTRQPTAHWAEQWPMLCAACLSVRTD